jgi:hypothetical protein
MKKEVEMVTVQCDNCKKDFKDEHMGYSCWGSLSDAWEYASESGWIHGDDFDTHYCPDCYSYDDNDNLVLNESRKK